MHDIKWIRDNQKAFDGGLKKRGLSAQAETLVALDAKRREAETRVQTVQAERNKLSKEIGTIKAKGGDATDVMAKVAASKEEQTQLENEAGDLGDALENTLSIIPNLPADGVPEGKDEADNIEIKREGTPPQFDFSPKEHFDTGETLGQMDFKTAAKMSGARFVILSGGLARMERALASFMLDHHTSDEWGYTEVNPPALVRDEALFGTGQLPKFTEDLFRTEEGFWLIPTAEVPLTNIVAGEIVEESYLPRRFTAMTWCFRSEAGSAGKDTRGMIRQHQFSKVEMVSVVEPDKSWDELERMTACAEDILTQLGLAFRTVALCTGDMGFSAAKTYDIEVWLPGQDAYREISSCSNCLDFQARRMKARYRKEGEKGTTFLHTLNGSGLAIGRTLVAIMENYQQADGSVRVPDVLKPYMGGIEVITPNRS